MLELAPTTLQEPHMSVSSQFCSVTYARSLKLAMVMIFASHKLADHTYSGFLKSWVLIYQHANAPNLFFQLYLSVYFPNETSSLFIPFYFPLLNFPNSWPLLNLFILSGTLSSYSWSLPVYEHPTYPPYPTY